MNDNKNPSIDFLKSIDIHELLPQQEPFVMIDRLVEFGMTRTVTETKISQKNIFVDNGYFSASGLIENIAQTCAARIGYVNKYILQKGIQIGYIGAVRNLTIYDLPKVNDVITTTVEIQEEVFGMMLASAKIACNEHVYVDTEMKIAVKEE